MSEPAPYLVIVNDIREHIRNGDPGYRPGDTIPGEKALAEIYDVSRSTAERALRRIKLEHLVRPVRGQGTIVRAVPPVRRLTTARFSTDYRETGRGAYDVEMREAGFQGRTEWLDRDGLRLGPAPCPGDDGVGNQPATAELLGVEPGAQVMVRPRHMFAAPIGRDGRVLYEMEEPTQIATSYVPWGIAARVPGREPNGASGEPGITVADTGPGGLYSRIADAGHAPVRFEETVTGRVGADWECNLLRLEAGAAVLTVDRVAFDAGGRPVEVCRHVTAPETFVLVYDFLAE